MAMVSSLMVLLVALVLVQCNLVSGAECPDNVGCPYWPVRCGDGETPVDRYYYLKDGTRCTACPVCTGSSCPRVPVFKRSRTRRMLLREENCDKVEWYNFSVDINNRPCYAGQSYRCIDS